MSVRLPKFVAAVENFCWDGPGFIPVEQYAARLSICEPCEHRVNEFCMCNGKGCPLLSRAASQTWRCPDGRWP